MHLFMQKDHVSKAARLLEAYTHNKYLPPPEDLLPFSIRWRWRCTQTHKKHWEEYGEPESNVMLKMPSVDHIKDKAIIFCGKNILLATWEETLPIIMRISETKSSLHNAHKLKSPR